MRCSTIPVHFSKDLRCWTLLSNACSLAVIVNTRHHGRGKVVAVILSSNLVGDLTFDDFQADRLLANRCYLFYYH